ncbi:MAG: hypothetical protein EI684_15645 [Candidatus Viridilinea halotolerans]|uniref:Uncharacterized protein n=1 Tax=Candidatus Viridilinea halotolerans TaxID=2491704 RepID=A0A426TVM4_9CHLR|nr:MAG: hypothetical protein EI684_15645 [Candidatus Viridilinea halotolerans]
MEQLAAELLLFIGGAMGIIYTIQIIGEFLESLFLTFAKGIKAITAISILSWIASTLGLFNSFSL